MNARPSAHKAMPFHESIAIRVGRQYAILWLATVDWMEANGNYVRVHAQGRARVMSQTLTALERDVLDPAIFVRVHRSAIVNITKIASVEPYPHGDAGLVLACGTVVPCSRRYRNRLRQLIFFSS